MWITQVRREKRVQTLQVWLEFLKIDWWPCSISAKVAVAVEYFVELIVELGVELIVELGVELVDELVVDMLVDCCWWVLQLATVWYPMNVVHS